MEFQALGQREGRRVQSSCSYHGSNLHPLFTEEAKRKNIRKDKRKLDVVARWVTSALRRRKQEDYCEFEAHTSYIVSSRSRSTTWQDRDQISIHQQLSTQPEKQPGELQDLNNNPQWSLNYPIKRCRQADETKKQDPTTCCLHETQFPGKRTRRLDSSGRQ